jgi:D-beta-D-heptose 7-phosphate kinase / D-beta-D-heptose 1-phosphate adenosyltransferase
LLNRLAGILENMKSATVTVVGDIMLDEYIIGDSERISPEAPTPILKEHERRNVPGGAANVAVNIASLGAKPLLFSIAGDDSDGKSLREAIKAGGVSDKGIFTVKGRPTTRKTRLIARGNQIMRLDREETYPIDAETENALAEAILKKSSDYVIISDYSKGVVTASLVKKIIEAGKKCIVDPKSSDFGKYAGAFIVTPNLGEFLKAAGKENLTLDQMEAPAHKMMADFNISNILVTLGPDGMALFENGKGMVHIHSKSREVFDVTGAGDTVISTLSATLAGGANIQDSCNTANLAAGIVVGKRWTASTTTEEIIAYAFGPSASDKIVDEKSICGRLADLRKAGKKIVFTNGCFDILHVGHITYLNDARRIGDILVVGLNSDNSVSRLKGPNRPIISQNERSHMLAALECVDFVIIFDEPTPENLLRLIKPDFLVKGADYSHEGVVGHEIVEAYGGEVRLIPVVENMSTTNIIKRILSRQ